MLVTIAGCGALGGLLAARLIEGGHRVQAYQRPGPQLDALRSRGIVLESPGEHDARTFALVAVSDKPEALRPGRLIIVMTKAYDTPHLAPLRDLLADDGVVLTLQNGWGNAEVLAGVFGAERVAAGVATYGAYRTGPGRVHVGGKGDIIFGPWEPGRDHGWVADVLVQGGLDARYVENPRPAIWRKIAINAMINPTAALTRLSNREILNNAMAQALMRELGKEAVQASCRSGAHLEFDAVWELFMEHLSATEANKPSMLQDIEAGRQTEVDAILGAVLAYAWREEEMPFTRAVYGLLKAIDTRRFA